MGHRMFVGINRGVGVKAIKKYSAATSVTKCLSSCCSLSFFQRLRAPGVEQGKAFCRETGVGSQ